MIVRGPHLCRFKKNNNHPLYPMKIDKEAESRSEMHILRSYFVGQMQTLGNVRFVRLCLHL